MQDRHVSNMSFGAASAVGLIFAGGFMPAMMLCGVITLFALALQALLWPGIAIAGACVVILPLIALKVALSEPVPGRSKRPRRILVGGLLLGAILAFQIQWGSLGKVVDAMDPDRCAYHHLGEYGSTSKGASWFLSCRGHFSKDQTRQACTQLMAREESRTFRIRMYC